MAVSHVKSDTIADFTGTITGFNSQGSTTTIAATDLVRPADWNSAHNQFYTLTGNTIGNSTASGTNVLFAGSNGIVVGGSTGTVVFQRRIESGHNPFAPGVEIVYGQQGQASCHVQPLTNDAPFQFDRIVLGWAGSAASNSSFSATVSIAVGLYTNNANTLSVFASTSTSYAITASGTVGSYSLWAGPRNVTIPWTSTITQDVWLGVWSRTTTAGGAGFTFNQGLASQPNSAFSGILGAASAASVQSRVGFGQYASTSTTLPSSIPISTIIGTASIGLRPPVFFFGSGTV